MIINYVILHEMVVFQVENACNSFLLCLFTIYQDTADPFKMSIVPILHAILRKLLKIEGCQTLVGRKL